MSALAAEASGVDLLFVCLPRCHVEVAKATSLNFQIHPFQGEDLRKKDVRGILELLATMDAATLGPGIAHGDHEAITAIRSIIAEAPCPLVLDAAALQPETIAITRGKIAVLTPHIAELERMGIAPGDLRRQACDVGVTIFLKGPTDTVIGPDGKEEKLTGGNAGLTVGGTGDALAGLIAGLLAQGSAPFEAATCAGRIMKRAATLLYHEYGYAFTTRHVIEQIPHLLHTIDQ
jgi:NAD(P)H-hydrate epimerase